ncbi:Evolutionarily conserved signaling intermediate in Toll pathway, mitochondrial [Pseudolycoriella hygida]|uniref:Evolutionarily conserved signaling intermediate in Toll pathway, mitochondrial n=1 Tax=Pseudolycoriella hygida TaxID=35572 RepID=A0A9Q0RWH0_9DIPT|nr:Evolutionarily conserved signaling intermediate in Toll pathway, mitochondrial [Pseudolycoriella hygida]
MHFLRNQLSKLGRQSLILSERYYPIRYDSNTSTDEKKTDDKNKNFVFEKQLTLQSSFENITEKNRDTYLAMVDVFLDRDVHRRNHVEFIYAALKHMETFGVHRDVEVYKALMNVMPKEKFIPRNMFQAEFMHYPKQQQCIIDLLEQMEDNGVMPDFEMQAILLNTFGRRGHPTIKYMRMMYWMPKFKNQSPWLLPNPVPNDALELAKMAVKRMCTVDLHSNVDVYHTNEVESAIDDTWIVSGMSPEQMQLLAQHSPEKSLRIEGPHLIWLRNQSLNYFVLKGDGKEYPMSTDDDEDMDDVSNLTFNKYGWATSKQKQVDVKRSVHEQRDGVIYAVCATGTSTKDSLLSWIRLLEKNGNPCLGQIPVLFKFRSNVAENLLVTSS